MRIILVFLFLLSYFGTYAQEDTVPTPPRRDTSVARDTSRTIARPDTTPARTDVERPVRRDPQPRPDTIINTTDSTVIDSLEQTRLDSIDQVFRANSVSTFWRRLYGSATQLYAMLGVTTLRDEFDSPKRTFTGEEPIFYYIIFMLLLFGLLRQAFEKYFIDLFRVFFRTTLKQRQIREQLLQSPLPSVFLNGYFVLSAGLYINFLLDHYNYTLHENFWIQYLYCIGGLTAIYLVKFMGLKLTGWVFNVRNATDSYTFIVFLVNKMLGIFLLPFLVILAFSHGNFLQASLVVSWVGIGLLYIYRFILSYAAVRNEITLNPFHFILYLLAFEVVPLLLIYKLLLVIF